jgi:hypothetical protein
MTYACTAWEFSADTHLLKLQPLQNKVLRTTGKFPRRTPVRELHMAFQVPYIHVHIYVITWRNCAGNKQRPYKITKMQMFTTSEEETPDIENIRGLNLASVKRTTVQVTSYMYCSSLPRILQSPYPRWLYHRNNIWRNLCDKRRVDYLVCS